MVKVTHIAKTKPRFVFTLPRRILYYSNIAKVERNAKQSLICFCFAKTHPILFKYTNFSTTKTISSRLFSPTHI